MNRWTFPIALALALLCGCADILEEDLDGVGVVLLTPPDGHISTTNLIQFKWEPVPYADSYVIQIARPDLQNPEVYITDSVVEAAVVSFTLQPGQYEWQVRAQNGSSHTAFYRRSLTVLEPTSLEGLFPLLVSPSDGAVTNAQDITFDWDTLPGTVDHRFELREGDQNGPVSQAQLIPGSSITLSGIAEGDYTWGIQAQNSTSVSNFSYRAITIDRTAPSAPLLIAPAASATVPDAPLTFTWQSGIDLASATGDSLIVTDANQVQVIALGVGGDTYTDSLGTGTYQWQVRTTDAAGNGTSSGPRTFTVQ